MANGISFSLLLMSLLSLFSFTSLVSLFCSSREKPFIENLLLKKEPAGDKILVWLGVLILTETPFLVLLPYAFIIFSYSSSSISPYFNFILSIFFALKGFCWYKKHIICNKTSLFLFCTVSSNCSKFILSSYFLKVLLTISSISSQLFICTPKISLTDSSFLSFSSETSFNGK